MKPEHITAWALNELLPEETAALEDALQENPQALNDAQDARAFCDMLTRELTDESLALAPDQRDLLQSMSLAQPNHRPVTLATRRPHHGWSWQGPTGLAAAACVALLAWMGMKQEVEQQPEMAKDERDLSASEPSATVRVMPPEPDTRIRHKVQEKKPVPLPESEARRRALTSASPVTSSSEMPSLQLAAAPVESKPLTLPGATRVYGRGAPASPSAPAQPQGTLIAGDKIVLSGGFVLTGSATTLENTGTGSLTIADTPADAYPYRVGRNDTSGESYTRIVENSLLDVQREPLSTFSIDVDTASYANVRRFLNQNTRPPADAVRIEELVNYFPTSEEGPPPGAEHPFAVKVEISSCPWQPRHRLARVHLQARDIGRERPASNLVFLVDVSGSMSSEDKLPLVRRSLQMLAERLGENDRVSMVTYAGGTQVVLPSVNGLQKANIIAAIDRLQSGGSTHGSAGIRLAYEQAVAGFIQGGVNRVILCTDGDFNVGISDPAELEGFITEKARSGVFLSVLGFGTGNLQDRTMETLADKGNGNYAYVDSLGEARKVLVEQMNGTLVTVAKDVKIQIEFNPAVVRQYRLIGYENRLLAKEDFNDDTKDAGEIGAG
ncbi:MAG TPA: hypothetical protein DIT64_19610, partial [Verrucomicrobiales bacterium]|nr:hypothetical protein [Verrucomicrobiales bacterium]